MVTHSLVTWNVLLVQIKDASAETRHDAFLDFVVKLQGIKFMSNLFMPSNMFCDQTNIATLSGINSSHLQYRKKVNPITGLTASWFQNKKSDRIFFNAISRYDALCCALQHKN